ncbi:MAG TPA: HD domain-containing phosphohydrolase [Capillimicrobium sp.]|jgi:CHASE3 domain sensor protein
MPRSIVARVVTLGALLVAVMAVGGLVFVGAADRTLGAWSEREQSDVVLDTIDEARQQVIDVETGLRGFQLTGEERYLEPTWAAIAVLPQTMTRLQAGTEGQPALHVMAHDVETAVVEYVHAYTLPLIYRLRGGVRRPREEATTGKLQVDALRGAFERLQAGERAYQRRASDAVREAGADARRIALAAVAGAILLLLAFTVIVARGIAAPVRRIACAADALAEGRLDERVPERGHGEIADLARAFNHMAGGLRAAHGELEGRVQATSAEAERARLETLERLALASEYRDDETQEHAHRIGRSAAAIGRRLGLDGCACERLRRAGPLHDIGKVAVPDAILLKPGRLTPDELAVVREHPEVGARILAGSESPVLQLAEEIARTHHERWDGAGYPTGAAGPEIPLAGRIVAVADVFDALTHERPYKPAWSVAAAVAEIEAGAGTQFDPDVVEAFRALDHDALVHALDPEPPAARMGLAA